MHRLRLAPLFVMFACGGGGGAKDDVDGGVDASSVDAAPAPACNDLPAVCAARWEENASNKFDMVLTDPAGLAAFLTAVP